MPTSTNATPNSSSFVGLGLGSRERGRREDPGLTVSARPFRRRGGAVIDVERLLCEWFPGAPPKVEVVEESMGLGRYGRVLTALRPGALPDPDDEQEREWRGRRTRDDD